MLSDKLRMIGQADNSISKTQCVLVIKLFTSDIVCSIAIGIDDEAA